MNFFRKIAAPIVAVVSIAFLAWMVFNLSGITGGDGLAMARSAGKVDGQSLDARDYELMVQRESQQDQQQNQTSLGTDDYARIRDKVWNEWVDQAVLNAEFQRRGITVSDEELADAIRTTPLPELAQNEALQTDGRFDMQKYQRWLMSSTAAQILPALEGRYRAEMMRNKLLRVVTADVFVSDAELWRKYRDEHERVSVDITAIIPRNAIPDSAVTVTPAEVDAYYRDHGDEFKRPEIAYLSYINTPRVLNAEDTTAARARIQAIRAEIVAGAKFEDVARRESQDPVSAIRGGELGQWTKGQMVPKFDSIAMKLPIGQLSEPFLTEFGYHIMKVAARTGDKITASHILVNIELSGAHRDSVDATAGMLERLAADRIDGAALDTAAKVLGLRIGRTLPVQRGTRVEAAGVVVPNVGTWAFQKAVPGAISTVEETEEALYLFRIDSMTPAGIPPLASIRDAVEHLAREAKKWEAAKSVGAELQKRLDEGASLDMAARALGLPHQVVGPFTRVNPPFPNPTFTGAAFALQPGQRSGILDTSDGYYLLQSVTRTPADSAAYTAGYDELRAGAIRQARQDRARIYLAALRENAKIVDRRDEIQRENDQAQAAAEAKTGR